MKKLWFLLIPTMVLAGALAGCSTGPLPGSPPVGANKASSAIADSKATPSTKPTGEPASAAPDGDPNVCKEVPIATVNLLTGRKYVKTESLHDSEFSGCAYEGANPKTLLFSLGWYGGGSARFTQMVNVFGKGLPTKPLSGVGDEAYDLTLSVVVRYGDDNYISSDQTAPDDFDIVPTQVLLQLIDALRAAR